jgi:hypothetical protein
VSATGFRPGEQVKITVLGNVLATVAADAHGSFTNAAVHLPLSVGPGAVTVSASGLQSQKTGSAPLTVTARIASLSVAPSTITAGATVRITGGNFLPGEQVSLAVNGGAAFATLRAGTDGSFTLTTTLPLSLNAGASQVTASGADSHVVAVQRVELYVPAPAKVGTTTWYFASGRTDSGYSEQINVLNAGQSSTHGTITFYYGTGSVSLTRVYEFSLAAHARGTFDANRILGVGTRFASVVQTDQPVVAARASQRGLQAMTSTSGVSAPSRTWYMAEGYTGLTFQEELDLLNPGSSIAQVRIAWPLFNGKAPVVRDVTLAPRTHLTIPVNAYVIRASHATTVTSDQPVVASRTMYFGLGQQGAHAREGAVRADTTLYFAEGSTNNGFEEYLTILNPSATQTAQVSATFYNRQGAHLGTATILIEPLHRGNIKVNDLARDSAIATVLQSTIPVVAERSMYFGAPNGGSADGTVVFGQAKPANAWAVASGNTQGARSEFELLFNPNPTSSTIVATYYGEDGRVLQKTFTLPGRTRLNIDVTLAVPELSRGLHGVVLQSVNGVSFVAEQALYDNGMRSGSASNGVSIE